MASAYQTLVAKQRKEAHEKMLTMKGAAVEKLAPLCINCGHYSAAYEFTYGKFQHHCHEPLLRDPVTGWPTDAMVNRKSGIGCGPNGVFFKLKPTAPPREVEVRDDGEPDDYVPPVPFLRLESRPTDDPACIRYRRAVNPGDSL